MKLTASICILLFCTQAFYAQQNDTINKTDAAGLKQGYWIILGVNKPNDCFKADLKVEEGNYTNNKKNGIWTEYFCSGRIKNTLEFKAGKPNGLCVSYHPNGTVSETGTFILNKWVGQYKLYFDNGKPQQIFMFNAKGKREGLQKYYYEKGSLQALSNMNDTLSAYIHFDTTGKLVEAYVNKKAIKEGVKLSKQEDALYKLLMDMATEENKPFIKSKEPVKDLSKKKASPKKVTEKHELQDINFNQKEIQNRN